MGYFNIIDSLSDKRVNECMLSKGGDTGVTTLLNDIIKGNFSGLKLDDDSFRGRNKKIYKAKELDRFSRGFNVQYIDYGNGVLGALFNRLSIARIVFYKIGDTPFKDAADKLFNTFGDDYIKYLSPSGRPGSKVYSPLADVIYDINTKRPCADDTSCFEVFASECLTSNVISRVKKLFIDSNFSDMVTYNNSPIWLRNYDKMENQGSVHVVTIPLDIANRDAINSFYKSIDGSLGSTIGQFISNSGKYYLSFYLTNKNAKLDGPYGDLW